jgi:hypothetical protein
MHQLWTRIGTDVTVYGFDLDEEEEKKWIIPDHRSGAKREKDKN